MVALLADSRLAVSVLAVLVVVGSAVGTAGPASAEPYCRGPSPPPICDGEPEPTGGPGGSPAPPPANRPFGHLDAVTTDHATIRVRGWAIDPDTTAPIMIRIQVDGLNNFTEADGPRPDVAAAHPGVGAGHGFDATLPTPHGFHDVCVHADDVGPGAGVDVNLGCHTVHLPPTAAPVGGPPVLDRDVSFEAYNQPGYYLRLSGEVPYFGRIHRMSELDLSDARFRRVRGLSDASCLSFESVAHPGRYLRHWDNLIRVSARGVFDLAFDGDATFCLGANNRYESANKRGYYLRHVGTALTLSRIDRPSWEDETASADSLIFAQPPVSFRFVNAGATYRDGELDEVLRVWGECTGLALIGVPRTTTVAWRVDELTFPPGTSHRVVRRSAVGTPLAGFYPWIKFYSRRGEPLSPIYKIETGVTVCAF